MKTKLFLIIAFLIAGLSWGQTTVTYSFASGTAVTGLDEASPGIAVDPNVGFGSFKNSSGTNPAINSSQLRLYQHATKGGSIKIYAKNGVTITKVVINSASSGDGDGPAGYSVDNTTEVGTFSGGGTMTMNVSASNYVEFYNKGGNNTSRTYVNSFEVTYISVPLNDTDTEVFLPTTQVPTGIISSTTTASGSAVDMFKMTIEDQGSGDGLSTKVTKIRVKPHTTNTADWTDHIQGIVLDDGNNYLTPTSVTITDTYIDIVLPNTALVIADGGNVDLTLGVYLNTTNIVDYGVLSFMVDADSHGFTADTSGSGFATTFTLGDFNSNDFIVDVTATKLLFLQQPTNTAINVAMSPAVTVKACDANGNIDTDINSGIEITSTGTLTGSPVSGTVSNGVATFNALTHTATGTGLTLTATKTGLTNITSSTFNISLLSSATDYFRTKATGNWSNVATWESSSDNINWIDATLSPTSSAESITINAHTVSVDANVTADQVQVISGGQITINSGKTLTIANGIDNDLIVDGTLQNNGTLVLQGATTTAINNIFNNSGSLTLNTGTTSINVNGTWNQNTGTAISNSNNGVITFNANSIYNHSTNGGTIPKATWNVASTCIIKGMTNSTPSGLNQVFGNFTWNCSSQSTYAILDVTGTFNTKGLFSLQNTGTYVLEFDNTGAGNYYYLDGGLTISGGTLVANYASSQAVKNGIIVTGNTLISGTGKIDLVQGSGSSSTSYYASVLYLNGNLTITSSASYPITNTSSNNLALILFQGNDVQYLSTTSSTNSRYVNYEIFDTSSVTLTSDYSIYSSSSSIYDEFDVYGTLNFDTFVVKQNSGTQARFNSYDGSTLITSHTGGLLSAIAVAGAKSLAAGTSYVFNGNTTTPFTISGTFGNPKNITVNANVTSNKTSTITVTGNVDVNEPATFKLNTTNNNSLSLGATSNLNIALNATFDNGGENQVLGTGNIILNGTFITQDAQGFAGTDAAIPTIVPTLNAGSTVEYAGTAQAVTASPNYKNVKVSTAGVKTVANDVTIAEDLTVTAGQLLVQSDKNLTVTDQVVNTGGTITFENNASLIQNSATTTNGNSGNIIYKRTSPVFSGTNHYEYWSAPVSGTTLASITNSDNWWSHNQATNYWTQASATTSMENGKGYIVRCPSTGVAQAATFEGIPNNGDITVTGLIPDVTTGNFATVGSDTSFLVGNPYPSALDLEKFYEDNSGVIASTFYFWAHITQYTSGLTYSFGDYCTYNAVLGTGTGTGSAGSGTGAVVGSQYLAAAQSAFVDMAASPTGSEVVFKNTHRVAGNNNNFYRVLNTNLTSDKIWFNLKNEEGLFKQNLLAYTATATNGVDYIDAITYDSHPTLDFYTLADNKKMVIQAREPFTTTDVVPMGYRVATAGSYTLEIDHLDNVWNTQNIYLKDNTLNAVHNIKAAPYTFTTEAGTFDNRFEIIYQGNILQTPDWSNTSDVVIYTVNNHVRVESVQSPIHSVTVYDIQGRKLTEVSNANSNLVELPLHIQHQVLIVKVTQTNGAVTSQKLMW